MCAIVCFRHQFLWHFVAKPDGSSSAPRLCEYRTTTSSAAAFDFGLCTLGRCKQKAGESRFLTALGMTSQKSEGEGEGKSKDKN
jgi:hypothetical protein